MSLKPTKRGYKVWARSCATTGYMCDFDVCTHTEMTMLSQPCHKVATMLFFFTTLSPHCYNLGTTLYFETLARLLQGGGKVVTRLYKLCHKVATMPFHNLGTILPQRCHDIVTRLLLHCHKGLSQPHHKTCYNLVFYCAIWSKVLFPVYRHLLK